MAKSFIQNTLVVILLLSLCSIAQSNDAPYNRPFTPEDATIVPAEQYDDLIHTFRCTLFNKQRKLIADWDQYNETVSGLIQASEETLEIAKYCQKHPDTDLSCDILNCLVEYNERCLQYYCTENEEFKKRRDEFLESMRPLVEQAKDALGAEFEVDDELENIERVMSDGVVCYYEQLNWFVKQAIYMYLQSRGLR